MGERPMKIVRASLVALGLALTAGPVLAQPYPPPGPPPGPPGPSYGGRMVYREPPPLRAERMPPPPRRDYVWKPGRWQWTGRDWVWRNGRYSAPPRRNVAWEQGHWERRGPGWVWIEGRWVGRR